ncbi:MAG: serine/threonine-protein kinase [Gemmatimonadales bacterium]
MSDAPDELFLELQSVLAGRYSLERVLGRGGMGIVYLARDVALDRPVAIKLLPPALADRPEFRQRFLREARTAARLSHPNIVPIHAVEESGRLVWFVMAYVPGQSLGQRIRDGGPLTPSEASRVLRDVAWALGYAHSQGVVHRDVKPDNILLEAGTRRALIADFGIAAPQLDATETSGVLGTVAYLSPEQARGDPADGRSDIYALGVVGWCALSAKLPYAVTTLEELVAQHLAGAPPNCATAAPHAPRAICRVIDRCLAHYPSARFQTAEQLAEALDQLAAAPSELPAPLRVWLTKGRDARTGLAVWSLLWGIPAISALMAAIVGTFPGVLAITIFAGSMGVLPWSVYATARVMQTRKVLAAGYTPNDLVLAIRSYAERRQEELAFEIGKPPSALGRVIRRVTWVAFVGAIAGVFALPFVTPVLKVFGYGWMGLALLAVGGAGLGTIIPGREIPARDRVATWQEKFWTSGVGRLLTRMAGWRLKRTSAPEQTLHRPTEVALGEAADALFRALPGGQRQELKQLPEQIRYLSAQAQAMRRKLEELDDLIAQAAPDTLFGEKRDGDGGARELKEAREIWAKGLRETVTLLESLRVGLLKLHAGSAVPDTLTADLDAARDLRARLSLLADAHGSVSELLDRPTPEGDRPARS